MQATVSSHGQLMQSGQGGEFKKPPEKPLEEEVTHASGQKQATPKQQICLNKPYLNMWQPQPTVAQLAFIHPMSIWVFGFSNLSRRPNGIAVATSMHLFTCGSRKRIPLVLPASYCAMPLVLVPDPSLGGAHMPQARQIA